MVKRRNDGNPSIDDLERAPLPATSERSSRHFTPLDSLRGLAALTVVIHHFVISEAVKRSFVDRGPADIAFVHNGGLVVDFFFVLSGIVIALSYAGPDKPSFSLRDFVIRRVARIYPLHIVMLLVMLGLKLIKLALVAYGGVSLPDAGTNNAYTFFANVFLLHALGFTENLSWNGPSWSISAEFYTYLLFGLIMVVAGKLKSRAALYVFAACVSILSIFLIIEVLGMVSLEFHARFGILRCTYSFFIGVLTFGAVRHVSRFAPQLLGGAIQWSSLLVSLVLLTLVGAYPSLSLVAPFAFALLLGSLMAFPDLSLPRLLSPRPLVWLGERSYSIYMTHAAVLIFFEVGIGKLFGQRFQTASELASGTVASVMLVAMIVVVLIVSDFTYAHIEKPGSRLVRRWLEPKSGKSLIGGQMTSESGARS